MSKSDTTKSKFLSLVLRHQPELIDIQLDDQGWTDVTTLLKQCTAHGQALAMEDLQRIVAEDNKQRYSFSGDNQRIRANQGHSVQVELGYQPTMPPARLYHGTAQRNLESIRTEGIHKGARHHVHLSPDEQTATNVGGRHGKPVVLIIDAGRMHTDGHQFYCSANGVWLTEQVPPQYIQLPETP